MIKSLYVLIISSENEKATVFSPILNQITFQNPKNEEQLTTLIVSISLSVACAFLAVLFTKLTILFFYLKKRYSGIIIYKYQILYV